MNKGPLLSPEGAVNSIREVLSVYISNHPSDGWKVQAEKALVDFKKAFPLSTDPESVTAPQPLSFDTLTPYVMSMAANFNSMIKWVLFLHGSSTLRGHLENTANNWPTQKDYELALAKQKAEAAESARQRLEEEKQQLEAAQKKLESEKAETEAAKQRLEAEKAETEAARRRLEDEVATKGAEQIRLELAKAEVEAAKEQLLREKAEAEALARQQIESEKSIREALQARLLQRQVELEQQLAEQQALLEEQQTGQTQAAEQNSRAMDDLNRRLADLRLVNTQLAERLKQVTPTPSEAANQAKEGAQTRAKNRAGRGGKNDH